MQYGHWAIMHTILTQGNGGRDSSKVFWHVDTPFQVGSNYDESIAGFEESENKIENAFPFKLHMTATMGISMSTVL